MAAAPAAAPLTAEEDQTAETAEAAAPEAEDPMAAAVDSVATAEAVGTANPVAEDPERAAAADPTAEAVDPAEVAEAVAPAAADVIKRS